MYKKLLSEIVYNLFDNKDLNYKVKLNSNLELEHTSG